MTACWSRSISATWVPSLVTTRPGRSSVEEAEAPAHFVEGVGRNLGVDDFQELHGAIRPEFLEFVLVERLLEATTVPVTALDQFRVLIRQRVGRPELFVLHEQHKGEQVKAGSIQQLAG